LQDLQASGEQVKALDERKTLPPDLLEVMTLFRIVSHSRPPSFAGLAGIRITDIEAVYRMREVIIMPPDEFIEWMLWLDGVVISWHHAERAAKERNG
jgi:hypothetical protein